MLPGEQAAEAKTARKPRAKKTALMYAVDLLARQEQSSAKLREKLLRKGYAEAETEAAIARLVEKHYLNDADACARQFAYLSRFILMPKTDETIPRQQALGVARQLGYRPYHPALIKQQ